MLADDLRAILDRLEALRAGQPAGGLAAAEALDGAAWHLREALAALDDAAGD